MAAVSRGVIVSFREVDNFHQLPLEEATNILYNELLPICEAKGVMLSSYGNHAGQGSLSNVEKYNEEKASHQLFNVKRIQQAFASIHLIVQNTSQYKAGSYGLKHVVENHPSQTEYRYISNGDLIVAMLLKGYEARFGKRTEAMSVNCEFKVKA